MARSGTHARRACVALAVVGLSMAIAGPQSGAQMPSRAGDPTAVSFDLQATSFGIGPLVSDFSGTGGLVGTLDAVSGEFDGTLSLSVTADSLVTVTVDQSVPATGSIDPTTGAAVLEVDLTFGVALSAPFVTPPDCRVGPASLALTGQYDTTDGTLRLASDDFALPLSTDCGDQADTIDPYLDDANSARIVLIRSDLAALPVPVSPAATPAPAAPSYTG